MPVPLRTAGVLILLAALGTLALMPLLHHSRREPVTNSADAVLKAKAAWSSVHSKTPWNDHYSAANVARFEPYTASLNGGMWIVSGTVPSGSSPKDMPLAHIREIDGTTDVTYGQ